MPCFEGFDSPRIIAVMLGRVICNDMVDSQIKNSNSEMTQVKDGINVTLQKVEFAPNATKAFLSIKITIIMRLMIFFSTVHQIRLLSQEKNNMK
jgi:hypothetical protein